ncbi:MAG: RagB/SusD family nutrient uptake outer membrane protein, partial [Bacteroidales bacterium]
EGLRWFDIKRWKAGSEYLNGYIYGAKFANSNSEHIRLDNRRFLETRDYLWSVPQSQSDLNENLRPNNPGYAN